MRKLVMNFKKILSVAFTLTLLLNTKSVFSQTFPLNIDTTERAVCGYHPDFLIESPSRAMARALYPANAIFNCGAFDLYYEDIALATGTGFDDAGLGAARRNTLCAVYQYVQTIFNFNNIPANDRIAIEIRSNTVNNTPLAAGTLAVAGPVYPNSGAPGIYNGSLLNHVLTNASPNPALFDAILQVNYTPTGGFYHNTIALPVPNCTYDLFTVLLHEVGHQLGFGSLLREDATFRPVSAFGNNQYTLFDWQNLWHGNVAAPLSFEKIVAGTLANPIINPAIPNTQNYLRDEQLWLNNNGRFQNNLPIYSGIQIPGFSFLTPTSVASHMDGEYMSFTERFSLSPGFMKPHSMQPYVAVGEARREFSEQEIRIFLQLGYTLNPAYPTPGIINNNRPPFTTKQVTARTNPNFTFPDLVQPADFVVTNNGIPLVITLANDATLQDPDGDIIQVENNTIYNIRGCGNGNNHNQLVVNPAGTQITFTPRTNFFGRAQFGFYLHDGNERGSFMVYTVDVTNGPAFANTPNVNTPAGNAELVVNGDFEEGTEIRRNTNIAEESIVNTFLQLRREEGLFYCGNSFADAHPLQYSNWVWTSSNGIIIGNSQKNCNQPITPIEFGSNPFSFPNAAFNNPNPNTGSRYSFILGGHNYSTLTDPLQQCHRYIARFDVNFANTGLVVGSNYTFNLVINNAVAVPNVALQTIPVNIVVGNGWQTITVPFAYCSNTPGNFLNFVSVDGRKVYYDNVSLIEDFNPPPLTVTTAATNTTICSGRSTTITSTVTNGFCNLTYTWNPGGAATSAITVSPAVSTTYTVTVNDGCRTAASTIAITVNPTPIVVATATPANICLGASSTLTATVTAGATYSWTPAAGLNTTTGSTVIASPTVTTNYIVTVTAANGCTNSSSVTVTVTGTCCTGTTVIPPGANSTTYGTSLSGTVVINGTFTINNNFLFNGATVLLGSMARIDILAGNILTINGSTLSACVNLWDGIYINGTTAGLTVTNSTIRDAENAVVSLNGGPYGLTNCIMDRNHIGVDVRSFNGAHTGTITNTQFTSSATLRSPRSGQRGFAGVMLTSVSGGININGGNNIFDNLDYGVYGTNSNATIQRNIFRNLTGKIQTNTCSCSVPPPPGGCPPCIIPPPVGIGVFMTCASPNAFTVLVGGTTATLGNTFQQCFQAVNTSNYATVTVQRNTINNSSVSSPLSTNPIGNTGVMIRNGNGVFVTVNVRNNTITNYRSGINYTLDDQSILVNAAVNIIANTISAPLQASFNGITVQSVLVAPGTPVLMVGGIPWLVQSNTITQSNIGVNVINMTTPDLRVLTNTISIKNLATRYGIRVQNSGNTLVQTNTMNGPGNTNLNIRGISIELSRVKAHNNTINNCGVGIQCLGTSNPTTLTCNKMYSCQRGVFLNNSDIGNQQPGGGVPSDNQWFNSTSIDIFRNAGVINTWDIRNAATYLPSLSPAGTAISISLLGSGAPNNCSPVNCNPACQQQLMAQITGNQIQFQSFVPQSQLLSKQSVYNDLESDASLMQQGTPEDAVLQNFHDSVKFTCIGKLRTVHDLISAGNIAQAITENNGTAPVCTIEQNHKKFNEVYLAALSTGSNGFTEQQKADLISIAEQCPLTGGTSVYQARVLLSIINDSTVDYDDECTGENQGIIFYNNNHLPAVQQASSNAAFKLYPNPNNGNMQLDYTLEKEQKGMFVIYDLLGKKQAEYELQQDTNTISINEAMLNNGIYFYKVLVNDKLVSTDKLVIVK